MSTSEFTFDGLHRAKQNSYPESKDWVDPTQMSSIGLSATEIPVPLRDGK